MMDMMDIIGSLWEYGALVVVLALGVWRLWVRITYLENELIKLSKEYSEAIQELNILIKGPNND
jgi:hypothetical protein